MALSSTRAGTAPPGADPRPGAARLARDDEADAGAGGFPAAYGSAPRRVFKSRPARREGQSRARVEGQSRARVAVRRPSFRMPACPWNGASLPP